MASAARDRFGFVTQSIFKQTTKAPATLRSAGALQKVILVLKVENVSKEYPTPSGPLKIVSEVSLSLSRGDAVSIMGPSGSGKSTLLYIMGALEPPSSGTVTLDGQNPFQLKEKALAAFRNKEIGFIFQDHCLLPQCSVLENVLTPTLVSTSSDDAVERARVLLGHVGLGDRLDHRPAKLSGGEKQRVALARALITKPQLLLCDEPTGNLDHKAADVVASLLLELHGQQETILVVVTHSAELGSRFPVRYELIDQQLRQL
ncbi:MAG: ABC transporter ATP-binding protein [bacterium]